MTMIQSNVDKVSNINERTYSTFTTGYDEIVRAIQKIETDGEFVKFKDGTKIGSDLWEYLRQLFGFSEEINSKTKYIHEKVQRFCTDQSYANNKEI